jgi:hypothetical protein
MILLRGMIRVWKLIRPREYSPDFHEALGPFSAIRYMLPVKGKSSHFGLDIHRASMYNSSR